MEPVTWIVGIDLSGPGNAGDTALAAFQEQASASKGLILSTVSQGWDDLALADWIVHQVPEAVPLIVGLDAPLSYNIGGGDRPGDRALRRLAVQAGLSPGTVMPPTLTRMAYLTLRGMAVARLLQALRPQTVQVVEVHPACCLALRGVPAADISGLKRDAGARITLLRALEALGLGGVTGLPEPSDHQVAACAAALGAWHWHQGSAVWCHPATPPIHPFDFAC